MVAVRESRHDGSLSFVSGASRTGKTSFVMLATEDALPLLVWDVEGQWSAMRKARSVTRVELLQFTKARQFGRFALTEPPTQEAFSFFCQVAFFWAQLVPSATVVVEELADVTHPGKAPINWGVLVRRGLKYGCHIYAITAAPAESDKTAMRTSTRMVCFRMERSADRRTMALELDVSLAEVESLEPLHYLERRRGVGVTRNEITLADLRKLAAPGLH